jgi:Pyruvate/2-oxoacid:ferredoxin oxidoreductase delta subunit
MENNMCEFCHQHGDGKKWYLKAEHYSEELLDKLGGRRFLGEFLPTYGQLKAAEVEAGFQKAVQSPAWLRKLIYYFQERRQRRDHFGQVVPLEDLAKIMDLTTSIVRIPCICRKMNKGANNAEYCFGFGLDAEKMLDMKEAIMKTFQMGPDDAHFDRLSKEEALELLRGFEKQGLVHTIWTFKTPFIGGLCNCDRADCLAMLCDRYDFHAFFRAEYVAAVRQEDCTGCQSCKPLCQFGAIGFSVMDQKTFIDPRRCYGCGICRTACEMNAIELTPRQEHPLARNLW